MSNTQRPWTPGTWQWENDIRPSIFCDGPGGYFGEGHLADVAKYENNAADARLIATSPDLYEKLEALANAAARLSNDDVYYVVADEVDAARAALAKVAEVSK